MEYRAVFCNEKPVSGLKTIDCEYLARLLLGFLEKKKVCLEISGSKDV